MTRAPTSCVGYQAETAPWWLESGPNGPKRSDRVLGGAFIYWRRPDGKGWRWMWVRNGEVVYGRNKTLRNARQELPYRVAHHLALPRQVIRYAAGRGRVWDVRG